jgi:hypothetical protein
MSYFARRSVAVTRERRAGVRYGSTGCQVPGDGHVGWLAGTFSTLESQLDLWPHYRAERCSSRRQDPRSKRSQAIEAEIRRTGWAGYRARSVAARSTRSTKRRNSPRKLMPRWQAEVEAAGWAADRIRAEVTEARRFRLAPVDVDGAVKHVLSADGELARMKVFDARHVAIEVSPQSPATSLRRRRD